jgi:hypothetical protein
MAKKQTAGWGDKGWQRDARQPLLSPYPIDAVAKIVLQCITSVGHTRVPMKILKTRRQTVLLSQDQLALKAV